jgi:hypothetical protein
MDTMVSEFAVIYFPSVVPNPPINSQLEERGANGGRSWPKFGCCILGPEEGKK